VVRWRTWREATAEALYGPEGFYRRPEGPAGHFRTSAHASPLFAGAVARLLTRVDALLRHPDPLDLVDVGAGRGELLRGVTAALPEEVSARLRATGVEVADRPGDLPAGLGWSASLPDAVTGLVLANEWLDTVPCDVVVVTPGGPRLLEVDTADGDERPGPALPAADAAWLDAWWPLDHAAEGDRAEVGLPRDEAWADAVSRLRGGLAVAVDYAHERRDRAGGAYAAGTLAAYRAGRPVAPVPDGSCDVTAHVALDACAAAGVRAGAEATLLTRQREALAALGVEGRRPSRALATHDPRAYLAQLSGAGEAAELRDTAGLGGFGWLVQGVGVTPRDALGPGDARLSRTRPGSSSGWAAGPRAPDETTDDTRPPAGTTTTSGEP
jgi:SAM-dependent MidA family methyltransferase